MKTFFLLHSGALSGVEATPIQIEIAAKRGEMKIQFVGLPDNAVRESSQRVEAAIARSGYWFQPATIVVNLAPGDLRKEGPLYDLPIALGLLAAQKVIPLHDCSDYIIAGELGLSGRLRPIRGGLSLALLARKRGMKKVLLPMESAQEASLVDGIDVYGVTRLKEAVDHLSGEIPLEPIRGEHSRFRRKRVTACLDFADIKGQHSVRRAVEVAVAGNHNLLMIGPPGSGKSMIAKRIPGIMPEPTLDEFLEILCVQSAAGTSLSPDNQWFQRPFRSPHHTVSDVGLLGGGSIPGPGELSLAHNGVLFMDELPEFRRSALEVLRQPLEDGEVHISRSGGKITLPCRVMLVAALNPCPCGFLGDQRNSCNCSSAQIDRYRARLSGPLLDRIDIHIEAPALSVEELRRAEDGEPSAAIRSRIAGARDIQLARYRQSSHPGACTNSAMTAAEIKQFCNLSDRQGMILEKAMERLQLSARAYHRILKVARTIADLAGTEEISDSNLMEAIHYRSLDRANC